VIGLIVIGLIVTGLIVTGLIVTGLIVTGLIVSGLIVIGLGHRDASRCMFCRTLARQSGYQDDIRIVRHRQKLWLDRAGA
jgi:hypothetical protein